VFSPDFQPDLTLPLVFLPSSLVLCSSSSIEVFAGSKERGRIVLYAAENDLKTAVSSLAFQKKKKKKNSVQSGLVLLHSQRFQTYQNIYVFFTMMLQQRVISTTRCIMMLFSAQLPYTGTVFPIALKIWSCQQIGRKALSK